MVSLATVIFFSLIGGVFSLVGGLLLLTRKRSAQELVKYATPFAAGALLAAAFLDLLKEGIETGSADTVLLFGLIGVVSFFVLERFLNWFHHHHEHKERKLDPNTSLVVVGDTIHNFIDGIAIAAAFLVSAPTGIVATIAVAAHEIPQEIGDFGLLLKKGMSRRGVILVNIFSALATTIAAIIFFQLGSSTDISVEALLGLTAGFFIYIAASDIIPSIHDSSESRRILNLQSVMLIVGAVTVGLLTNYLHTYIDAGDDHALESGQSAESEGHSHDSQDAHYDDKDPDH